MYKFLKFNLLLITAYTHHFLIASSLFTLSLPFAPTASANDTISSTVDGFDKDSLKKLTEYRQRHRKTVQGWLCAAAFVQNNTVYTDCTTQPAPNGQTGREWCYVEVQSIGKGPRDWDFCLDQIDYNLLRHKASEIFVAKESDINFATKKLLHYQKELQKNIDRYNNICQTDSKYDERINTLQSLLDTSKRQINTFNNYKSYSIDISQKSSELFSLLELTRDDYINDARNCTAVIGYDMLPHSDGLVANFYPNIFFQGQPITIQHHDSIHVYWNNQLPVDIPLDDFSVVFKGYVEAPTTALYTFMTEASLGVRLFLEDDLIISTFQSVHHHITEDNTSKPLQLLGGKRYKIEFQSFNYAPLRYYNPYELSLSLSWKINDQHFEIVPREQFYSSPGGKLPRVFGLKGEHYGIGFMENGARPFIDSKDHYLADIPGKYIGTKYIKTKTHPTESKVVFYTTMDVVITVCLPKNTGFIPIGYSADGHSMGYFKAIQDTFSVYKTTDLCEPAVEQVEMEMYQMPYLSEKIDLDVPKDTSFIIAISPLTQEYNCHGQVKKLKVSFCTSSSIESEDFNCMHAFANENEDLGKKVANDGWRANNSLKKEEWLIVNFDKNVDLHTIHYHSLDKSQYIAKKITFLIGNEKITQELTRGKWNFDIKPKKLKNLKIILSDFEKTASDTTLSGIPSFGGRLAFYGIECSELVRESPRLDVIFKGRHVPVTIPKHSVQDNGMPASPLTNYNGFYYGWTNRSFPSSSCSKRVEKRGGIQFGENKWTLDVPFNGVYKVEVELGSPCKKHTSSLAINDEVIQQSIVLSAGEFLTLHFYITLDKTSRITLSTMDNSTVIQRFKINIAKL